MHVGYWWESQKRPLARPRRTWVDNIKIDLRQDGMVWIGLIWLRIGTSGGLLWPRYWIFGFHKMPGSSWVAAQFSDPQEGLSSVSKYVYLESLFSQSMHLTPPDYHLCGAMIGAVYKDALLEMKESTASFIRNIPPIEWPCLRKQDKTWRCLSTSVLGSFPTSVVTLAWKMHLYCRVYLGNATVINGFWIR
jgi:hypothetical protein